MRLNPAQLQRHLKGPMLPVYLVTGDEPLQRMEAMDLLRGAARSNGHDVREVLEVNKEFDWGQLNMAASSLSLFAERRLLELRIPSGAPGAEGSKALLEYIDRPAEDAVLVIETGKIDKRSQSAKWFQAIEKTGAVIPVWPVKSESLPGWLKQRMQARGLEAEPDAIAMLAVRVEGNLLAAAQEVEKLVLLYGGRELNSPLSLREVADAVTDSARYSIYDLVDTAIAGDALRSVKILNGLRDEGVAAALVLWALANEIRNLSQYAYRLQAGESSARVLAQVWANRKSLVQAALQRLSGRTWSILLTYCARADQVIKGSRSGREWDELMHICVGLAASRFLD